MQEARLGIETLINDAINGSKPSTNNSEHRSILGLCNVFRRSVSNFARIAFPPNRKLEKDQPSLFGALSADEIETMHELQDSWVSQPIVALPYAGSRHTLYKNTCNLQVGGVLLQD